MYRRSLWAALGRHPQGVTLHSCPGRLRRQAVFDHVFHSIAEQVDFAERRIGVWRHANPGNALVGDGCHDDPMLLEQMTGQLPVVEALDSDAADRQALTCKLPSMLAESYCEWIPSTGIWLNAVCEAVLALNALPWSLPD